MPSRDFRKQQTAVPLSYQQGKNTSNNVAQFDVTINPPDPLTGLVVTSIFTDIVTTGTTTVTLLYDGVTQWTWTTTSSLALTLSGPALFATAPYQTLVLRFAADASRTKSNVCITAATVRL